MTQKIKYSVEDIMKGHHELSSTDLLYTKKIISFIFMKSREGILDTLKKENLLTPQIKNAIKNA